MYLCMHGWPSAFAYGVGGFEIRDMMERLLRSGIVATARNSGQLRDVVSKILPYSVPRPTILEHSVKLVGPTVAKSKQSLLVERRLRPLIRCTDYRWRELFEAADVISEGAVRHEDQGPTYYGSTSILLNDRSHGGGFEDAERSTIIAMLEVDPHARVRAIRMACLEAQLRAKADIGSIRAELTLCEERRGIRISVDVEARILLELPRRNAGSVEGRPKR